jgi:hypothetical protein
MNSIVCLDNGDMIVAAAVQRESTRAGRSTCSTRESVRVLLVRRRSAKSSIRSSAALSRRVGCPST